MSTRTAELVTDEPVTERSSTFTPQVRELTPEELRAVGGGNPLINEIIIGAPPPPPPVPPAH